MTVSGQPDKECRKRNREHAMDRNKTLSTKKETIKKSVKWMGNAVSVLSILFVLRALLQTEFDISSVKDWRAFVLVCAAGIALKVCTVFLSGSAWRIWLEFFAGKRCSHREALCVYAKANIGKYLPGNVMHYVERNLFADKLQMSQKRIAAASVAEVLTLVLAAFFIGTVLAFPQLQEAVWAVLEKTGITEEQAFAFGIGGCVLAVAAVAVMAKLRMDILQAMGAAWKEAWRKGAARAFFAAFFLYVSVLLLLGLVLVLVYRYWIGRPDLHQAMQMISAYAIAWVMGFVVPGAPGGIGVRELVLTLLLSQTAGRDTIAALGVLHRLLTVAGDFTAYVSSRRL